MKTAKEFLIEKFIQSDDPKWISVDDNLPELDDEGKSDDVLIIGETCVFGEYYETKIPTIGWYNRDGWHNILPDQLKVNVTHWMYMPETPK